MKHIDSVRTLFKKTPVVAFNSIVLATGNRKYSYTLIHNLVKKGEIRRITKGYYTSQNDPSLSVFCFRPAYLGLQDAMSFHGIWEQETSPVIITTRKARNGIRNFLGSNVVVRRISSRHFFGIENKKCSDILLPVSDIEKTFIDMVYFNEMRNDTARLFERKINAAKLDSYLKKYDKRFSKKVLSFLPTVSS